MPQPYLPYFSDKRYSVGFEALKQRPAIASAIGNCISIWSYVDNEVGGLFGILLGVDSEAIYRVFVILRRWQNQRDALNAAAKGKLSGDENTVYERLITAYGSLEKQRNKLGHALFGICPDDETLLFTISLEDHVLWQAEILPKLASGNIPDDTHEGLKQSMYVYTLSELEALHGEMERLWFDFFYFNGYLRDPQNSFRIAEFRRLLESRH
jgi:hypothetical protein